MKKTTRELATELRMYADFLDSKPEFNTTCGANLYSDMSIGFYDKEEFVAAAKALGNAKKSYTDGEYAQFSLTSTEAPVRISISRDKVCTKKVIFECEPLFSPEEVETL